MGSQGSMGNVEQVTTVMLIPVRSNTAWWHDLCIPFGEIRFVKDGQNSAALMKGFRGLWQS